MSREKIVHNAHTVVSIETVDRNEVVGLYYYPEEKAKWYRKGKRAGFEYALGTYRYTQEELEKGELFDIPFPVEGEKAYYRPYVKVTFVNKEQQVINCQTIERARQVALKLELAFAKNRIEGWHSNPFTNINQIVNELEN